MLIGMTIGGAVLGGIGALLLWRQKKLENKANDIKYYDSVDLGVVLGSQKHVSGELGAGTFSQMVKLNATAELNPPLIGEFSKQEVVYYRARVVREYEKKERNKDSQGKVTERWVNRTDTVSDNTYGDQFMLNDGKGKVKVDVSGADLRLAKGHESYKTVDSGGMMKDLFKSFLVNTSEERTKGFRQYEDHIKVGQRLFVLGELHDRNGEPQVTRPKDKGTFIVSVQTEEEVLRKLASSAKWSKAGGYIVIGIGVAVLAASFFVKG
jgi:hypothetical protein